MSAAGSIARQFHRNDPWSARSVVAGISAITALLAALVVVLAAVLPQAHDRVGEISPGNELGADPAFTWLPGFSGYQDSSLNVTLVEAEQGRTPPVPPGLARFPVPGTAYISPALSRAIDADPSLAARIPGTIVGTIADEGLPNPQSLRAVAATDLHGWGYGAVGWGGGLMFDGDEVPLQEARMMLAAVALLPWLVVLGVIATALTARLRPRAAALVLLGASPAQVRRFVATAVALALVAPSVLGASVGVVLAAAVGRSGMLGLSYYAPGWAVLVAAVTIVVAIQCGVVFGVASFCARIGHRNAWSARSGPSAPVSQTSLVAGYGGAIALVLLAVPRWAGNDQMSASAPVLLAFLAAVAAILTGAGSVAARRLRSLGERDLAERRIAWVLAWRDVAFRTTQVRTQVVTLSTIMAVFLVASGVQLMIDQSNRPTPATWWTISVPGAELSTMDELAGRIGPGAVLTSDGGEVAGTTWGTCASLEAAFGTLRTRTAQGCEDGHTYDVGELTTIAVTEDGTVMRDETGKALVEGVAVAGDPTQVITVDPAEASSSGDDEDRIDAYYVLARFVDAAAAQDTVLPIVPAASFSISGGDYVAHVVAPQLERLTFGATVLGLLIALTGMALGSLTQSTTPSALSRLGMSRWTLARRGAARAAITTGAAALVASVCAVLIGQTYLAIGSMYVIDVQGIATVVGLGVAAVALAAVVAWLGPVLRREGNAAVRR